MVSEQRKEAFKQGTEAVIIDATGVGLNAEHL